MDVLERCEFSALRQGVRCAAYSAPTLWCRSCSRLTRRQQTVLRTLEFGNPRTARNIGVRSDVLWRLEERGLAARNHDMEPRWRITEAGRAALIANGGQ